MSPPFSSSVKIRLHSWGCRQPRVETWQEQPHTRHFHRRAITPWQRALHRHHRHPLPLGWPRHRATTDHYRTKNPVEFRSDSIHQQSPQIFDSKTYRLSVPSFLINYKYLALNSLLYIFTYYIKKNCYLDTRARHTVSFSVSMSAHLPLATCFSLGLPKLAGTQTHPIYIYLYLYIRPVKRRLYLKFTKFISI